MARNFLTPINLNVNELQNFVVGRLSGSSIDAITGAANLVGGRLQFDSTANTLRVYNGSAWQTVATGGSSLYVGTTQYTIGNSSGAVTTLAGMTSITSTLFVGALQGNADTATSATTAAALSPGANINGVGFTGASNITISAANPFGLTIGTGLQASTGSSPYTGSAAVTIAIDSTVATLTGSQTLTNKTFTSPTIQSTGAVFQGTSGSTTLVANTTASGTLTLPAATGTLATTTYVDTSIANSQAGFNVHAAVLVASTAAITGTYTAGTSDASQGTGQGATFVFTTAQIDGVTLAAANRVLLKNQTDQKQNGIYTVTGTPGANVTLTRATDFDNSVAGEVFPGDLAYVTSGTVNGGSTWAMNSTGTATTPTNAIKIGTDNITWAQFAGTTGGVLPVANGGTGASTLTGILKGNGTGAFTAASGTDVTTLISTNAVTNTNNANVTETVSGTYYLVMSPSVTTGFKALAQNSNANAISYVASTGALTATSFVGSGATLTSLNASNVSSGTLPGSVGVTAGSASSSFVVYNGTTPTTGQFDGSTTAPSGTTRLNYSGYLYATQLLPTGAIILGSNNFNLNMSAVNQSLNFFNNSTTGDLNVASALTTGNVNIATGTAFTTGAINIGTGAMSSGTKAINIGTAGATGSTTTIIIGTNAGTPTTTINGTVKLGAAAFATDGLLKTSSTNGTLAIATGAEIATAIGASTVTNATNAGNSTTVTATETTAATTYYPVFTTSGTGSKNLLLNAVTLPLSYLPSTGTLTTTILSAPTVSTTSNTSMFVASGGTLTVSAAAVSGNGFSVNVNAGNTTSTTTGTGGTVNVRGGSATGAGSTATAGNVNILAGTATVGTLATTGGNVAITAGDANITAGTGGNVTINAGNGSTKGTISIGTANTAGVTISGSQLTIDTATATFRSINVTSGATAVTANVIIGTGIATGTGVAATSGNVLVDVGYATGTSSTAGSILIGTRNAAGTSNAYAAPAAISIGQSSVTTTITGTVKLPTVVAAGPTAGFVKIATDGTLSTDTVAYGTGTVTAVSVVSANGFTGSSSGGATPALTLTTSVTGLLKGNGTAISQAAYSDLPVSADTTVTTYAAAVTPTIARKVTGTFTTVTSGTAVTVNHGFTNGVVAQLFDSGGVQVEVDVTTASGITTFSPTGISLTGYRYVIIG